MGKSSPYNHYMQRIDIDAQNPIDIEEEFNGLLYSKMEGINDIGETKNIYIEEYADSDRKRVFLPPDGNYANKGTVVTLTVLIVGEVEQRNTIIYNFLNHIRVGIHRYWDDARNREFDFIVTGKIKVSDEKWHGSQPYVEVEIPLQNLNGKTRLHQYN